MALLRAIEDELSEECLPWIEWAVDQSFMRP